MYVIFLLFVGALGWLQGMDRQEVLIFACIGTIMYFGMRIMMNICYDTDGENAARENSRKHFSRPSFSMSYNSATGKYTIKGGEDLDHSQRCQNSLNEWSRIERRLKWNNWIYGAWIVAAIVVLNNLG
jgi:hypothetical protein